MVELQARLLPWAATIADADANVCADDDVIPVAGMRMMAMEQLDEMVPNQNDPRNDCPAHDAAYRLDHL